MIFRSRRHYQFKTLDLVQEKSLKNSWGSKALIDPLTFDKEITDRALKEI